MNSAFNWATLSIPLMTIVMRTTELQINMHTVTDFMVRDGRCWSWWKITTETCSLYL